MKLIIDRFEGDYAVCEKEDRTMVDIRRSDLPSGAKEGEVLRLDGDSITRDFEGTSKRKAEIGKLTKDLWA